jgi:hypothetical protein
MNITKRERFNSLTLLNENPKDNYSFGSEFTRGYLQENRKRSLGKGYAPSSFINLFYPYGNSYQTKKLTNDLKNNPESNFDFLSSHSAVAYYPIDMLTKKIDRKWKIAITLRRLSPEIDIKQLIKNIE